MELKTKLLRLIGYKTEDEWEEEFEIEQMSKRHNIPKTSKAIAEKFVKKMYAHFDVGEGKKYVPLDNCLNENQMEQVVNNLSFDITAYALISVGRWHKIASQNVVIGFLIGFIMAYILFKAV